ncbi:MAG TPA: hypothetical protein PK951_01280 [Chitinophagaceae bacterium]|nr:hypothetical protein [Chitinophagaceae bacterium]HUM66338.1 hypothetical protein [Chitinophagaceae bacterium]
MRSVRNFLKGLEDERKIPESELHAVAILTKAMAPRAANAASDVMGKAVAKLMPL